MSNNLNQSSFQPIQKYNLFEIYKNHHLTESAIKERIKRQKGSINEVSELDLAIDMGTEITDQNHIGGALFVKQLAEKAQISSNSYVLDLCSGLGGPSRYIAFLYGCKVLGIDIIEKRCKEAHNLTKLVNLSHLVTFLCGDILSVEIPNQQFDVVWGQNSWIHIYNKKELISRCYQALKPNGKLAFEDVYCSTQLTADSIAMLEKLNNYWGAHIVSLAQWKKLINSSSFEISYEEDLSLELLRWLSRHSMALKAESISNVPQFELEGLECAKEMAEKRLIGYFRIVAKKE